MASYNRSRKQQTRLAFTPLPSSSPATKGYNKQIQDRAAAVSLAGSSPAKRRKVKDNDLDNGLRIAQLDGVNDGIPTPAASLREDAMQEVGETSQSDSEPIRSTQRRPSTQDKLSSRKKGRRQQQLDFSNARDPDSFSSPIKLSSPSKPQSSSRASMFNPPRQRPFLNISSDESEEELPSPGKLVAGKKNTRAKKPGAINDTGVRRTRSTQQAITIDSDSEGDNIVVSTEQSRPIEEESEDDEEEVDDESE